jgi:hypothetical protein
VPQPRAGRFNDQLFDAEPSRLQVSYDEHIDVTEIFVVEILVGVLAVHAKAHDLAFRAGEIRRHFHDVDVMIAAGKIQKESAEGDVRHSDLVLERYRASKLSAAFATRNIDPRRDEFHCHCGLLLYWLRLASKPAP